MDGSGVAAVCFFSLPGWIFCFLFVTGSFSGLVLVSQVIISTWYLRTLLKYKKKLKDVTNEKPINIYKKKGHQGQ